MEMELTFRSLLFPAGSSANGAYRASPFMMLDTARELEHEYQSDDWAHTGE
jgi:hypothetical protein